MFKKMSGLVLATVLVVNGPVHAEETTNTVVVPAEKQEQVQEQVVVDQKTVEQVKAIVAEVVAECKGAGLTNAQTVDVVAAVVPGFAALSKEQTQYLSLAGAAVGGFVLGMLVYKYAFAKAEPSKGGQDEQDGQGGRKNRPRGPLSRPGHELIATTIHGEEDNTPPTFSE